MAQVTEIRPFVYQTVAASTTDQTLVGISTTTTGGGPPLGAGTGSVNDVLERVILFPAATNAGTCSIKDGTTSITIYTAGTLADLSPIVIWLGVRSRNGAWKITTGSSMTAICVGHFT